MTEAQDRESYSDDQDRESYYTEPTQETGKRTMIRCILPRGANYGVAIYDLQQTLSWRYGGFTMYRMQGGWRDNNEQTIIEPGYVWEVSFEPSQVMEALAIDAFTIAAREMGQTWLHIERHEFEANHIKVS